MLSQNQRRAPVCSRKGVACPLISREGVKSVLLCRANSASLYVQCKLVLVRRADRSSLHDQCKLVLIRPSYPLTSYDQCKLVPIRPSYPLSLYVQCKPVLTCPAIPAPLHVQCRSVLLCRSHSRECEPVCLHPEIQNKKPQFQYHGVCRADRVHVHVRGQCKDGVFAGHAPRLDSGFNKNAINPRTNKKVSNKEWDHGTTNHAHFSSEIKDGQVVFKARGKPPGGARTLPASAPPVVAK
eukprot:2441260-Rhodomonas_salina.1